MHTEMQPECQGHAPKAGEGSINPLGGQSKRAPHSPCKHERGLSALKSKAGRLHLIATGRFTLSRSSQPRAAIIDCLMPAELDALIHSLKMDGFVCISISPT